MERLAQGYTWPKTSATAELRSLLVHYRLRYDRPTQEIGDSTRQEVLFAALQTMPQLNYHLPTDFLEYSHFKRVVNNLNWKSSPGYKYIQQGYTTNGQLFKTIDGIPNEERVRVMYEVVMGKIANKEASPIHVFIKPEPHKHKKIAQHRYRLIYSVCVDDTLIDAMLCGTMNKNMIDNYIDLPTKVGWSPYMGGWKLIPQINVQAIDVSAWDQLIELYLLYMVRDLRKYFCQNRTPIFDELLDWRYYELYENPILVFSNGVTLRQKFKGVLKSGSFNTISDNCLMWELTYLRTVVELNKQGKNVRVKPRLFMGDDCLMESQPPEFFERLGQLLNLKHIHPAAEFAGMRFIKDRIEPCYLGKHAYNLLHLDPDVAQEVAASYSLLYARSKHERFMRTVLLELGPLPPKEWTDAIVDGQY